MDKLNEVADDLKLLGDKTRLMMLGLLQEREWCVCEFVELFEISQPAISQHLRKLKDKGMVKESKRGQWVHYSLNVEGKPHITAVLHGLPDSHTLLASLNKTGVTACCD
ncbi:ArsR/SmtB family transcription factor [Paenibacillus sp. FSL R10-2736]|uniref:ArsR/SmtB family transcription factor n=1 Tax=Paenibacillus sp. FSL R10-2736 TaxID=2954692 RepID=UPI0030F5D2D8